MQSVTDPVRKRIQAYIDSRYPKWNLDAALRYLPVAEHLERSGAEQVLDVGSGGAGLSLYWGRSTIALDLSFSPAGYGSLVRPVLGSATALPFKARSIEVIVSSDVLEHIPRGDRTRVLSEMLRVARRQIIVAAPCGQRAHEAEREVARVYREKNDGTHRWLQEHLDHGLPEAEEVEEAIRSLAREHGGRARIRVAKNTNLRLWKWLFRHYLGGGPRTARLIRYYLLALIPVLRRIHWGEPYRKIFFVDLEHP
jgi:SAM-dependent methyltransferase